MAVFGMAPHAALSCTGMITTAICNGIKGNHNRTVAGKRAKSFNQQAMRPKAISERRS